MVNVAELLDKKILHRLDRHFCLPDERRCSEPLTSPIVKGSEAAIGRGLKYPLEPDNQSKAE
jgi:hypothetical protein